MNNGVYAEDNELQTSIASALRHRQATLSQPDFLTLLDNAARRAEQTTFHRPQPHWPVQLFISFSQPTASLNAWFEQAQRFQAPLFIRGLIQHSFKQTAQVLAPFAKRTHGGVLIDPNAFDRFHITRVPAVVVVNPAAPTQFDVVYGDVPLEQALQFIATHGQQTQAIAQQLLTTHQGDYVAMSP